MSKNDSSGNVRTLNDRIAIVGMSCRLPGGICNPESLWAALRSGQDLVGEVPSDRFDSDKFLHADSNKAGKLYTKAGGFLSDIAGFDAGFFGISPREASCIDPQQRLLLEMAVEAFDDAGIDVANLSGSDTAVYVGVSGSDYFNFQHLNTDSINAYTNAGGALSIVANRISYMFDLRGPSMAIDTACSSSLVALHQACHSLRNGESQMALTAGVNILLSPYPFIGFSKASMLSRQGRCHSFAEAADGYVRAEGGGLVVLKRLSDAIANGDRIHAIIDATGVNSDGRTVGLSLPSADAQEALLRQVYERGGVDPADLVYFEAHGTGTVAGDPIECRAIGRALGMARPVDSPLPIGSVKSNVGHLEPASGMAGLLKAILILRHREIPASLHGLPRSSAIDFAGLNLAPATQQISIDTDRAAVIGVNSFGFGGANAHVVLSEPFRPPTNEAPASPDLRALIISAHSKAALAETARRFDEHMASADSIYDICYTSCVRRTRHAHRFAAIGRTDADIKEKLRRFVDGDVAPGAATEPALRAGKIAFAFSGNGSQWAGMAADLLENEPVFRRTVDEIDAHVNEALGWSIIRELKAASSESRLALTEVAQPALFAIQLGLVAVLRERGFRPAAVFGHSVGEVAAAYVCGALDLETAIRVIVERSRAQGLTAGVGKMAAVGLSAADAEAALLGYEGELELAAVNSNADVTISGNASVIARLGKEMEQRGVFFRTLDLDYAFHSRHMDPIRAKFLAGLGQLELHSPHCSFISTVTGAPIGAAPLDTEYWWTNIRAPVLFAPAAHHLIGDGFDVFVEIGPHPVLKSYLRRLTDAVESAVAIIPTLTRGGNGVDDLDTTTAQLLATGARGACEAFFPHPGRIVDLPAYAWQRDRHWNGSPELWVRSAGGAPIDHPLLGSRLSSLEPTWQGRVDPSSISWLPDHKIGDAVVMPAVGYVEMALAAGRRALGGAVEILGLEIPKAFTIREDVEPEIQVSVSAEGAFRVASRNEAKADWQLHVQGRVQRRLGCSASAIDPDILRERLTEHWTGADYYVRLAAIGLPFGPAFQLLKDLHVGANEVLAEYLGNEEPHSQYEVMPPLVDAGLQAVLPLCLKLAAADLFLPSAMGKVRCWKAPAANGYIHVRLQSSSAREISCSVTIAHKDGSVAMTIENCRFRRFQSFNRLPPSIYHYEMRAAPRQDGAALPMPCSPTMMAAALAPEVDKLKAEWRTDFHYCVYLPRADELCGHFAAHALRTLHLSDEPFSVGDLLDAGVTSRYERLLNALTAMAEADGFLQRLESGRWRFAREPAPEPLFKAMVSDFAEYSAELVLLGRCGLHLPQVLRGERSPLELIFPEKGMATAEHLYDTAPGSRFYNALLRSTIQRLVASWPEDRPLRVIEIGGGTGGLTAAILPLLPPTRTHYVFTDVSDAFLARAEGRFQQQYDFVNYRRFDVERDPESQGFAENAFDIVVAANVFHATADLQRTLGHAARLLTPGGLLLGLEKHEERSLIVIFGLLDGWWRFSDLSIRSTSPLLSAEAWPQVLRDSGFDEVSILNDARADMASEDSVLLARRQESSMPASMLPKGKADHLWIIASEGIGDGWLAEGVARALTEAGCTTVRAFPVGKDAPDAPDVVSISFDNSEDWQALIDASAISPSRVNIAVLIGDEEIDPCGATVDRAMCLRALSKALSSRGASVGKALWLVTGASGALPQPEASHNPSHAAMWGVSRSLANEAPELDIRRLSVEWEAGSPQAAWDVARELLEPSAEDEIVLTKTGGRFAPRVLNFSGASSAAGGRDRPGYALEIQDQRVSYRLQWKEKLMSPPGSGEVAIAVKAAGLNYRDVLWAMGVLSEEAAAEGYFGAELGMECAGVVTAIGPGVVGLAPGDRVYAFAQASLASQTVAKATLVGRLPDKMTFAEGATLPIVFVTVHYTLSYLARLKRGETILIHGAAGGVGLAAVQYAQLVGARIVATAGSPEKRDLLRLMGIEHILDSRSLHFADEVMALTHGRGVDVVLNSLAGEAILRNLDILRPFGRFIELGKRDIYADSKIGLRPFRNNISFFGVDADKMMNSEPTLAHEIFSEVSERILQGKYRPLLHRTFPAERAEEAFRLLQHSRHIGKVIVTLDDSMPMIHGQAVSVALDPNGVYLVTGGLGGFGAATAVWLADHGARHLALVSRSGAAGREATATLEALARRGVTATAYAADVAKLEDMRRVIESIDSAGFPLRGVIHAAMVLDDAPLSELTPERFQAALAPKLQGGLVLDQITRDRELDLFLVFSSVTAVFGNPRQSNYAAGNLALESLIRARRKAGLPGLAVCWGTISGTGYVARNVGLAEAAQRSLGITPISPAEAFAALEQLLASDVEVAIVGHYDWSRMRQALPTLAAPRFAHLVPAETSDAVPGTEDLQDALQELEPQEVLPKIEHLTARLIADIFRTAPDRIDRGRRLADLGMDSLMAVELQTSLARQFGFDLPVMQIVGGGVRDLATRIYTRLGFQAIEG
jgi:acyl transferase domain-containing protein/NADPH:quinone reductase-like Zn-dependent oxidoreductase/SAM-dependent methyltransferase/NADP-dependent 3-hydroxy acid dehydrogenase YdfG/acyl carrier protein